MKLIVVWVLIINHGGNYNGGTGVVDNIATRESCVAAATFLQRHRGVEDAVCIPVQRQVHR